MSDKSKGGLEILQAAILIGILCDVLLREMPWGLNVSLVVGTMAAAIVMLFRRRKCEIWNAQAAGIVSAMVFFGSSFAWRDSIELKLLDTFAILALLAVLILPSLRIEFKSAGIFNFVTGFLWAGLNAAFAPFVLLFSDIEWAAVSQQGWKKHLVAVLRGIAIAAPLVFIFGALFVAADAVFQGIVERTLNIRADLVLQHAFMIAFFSWVSAGYLRGIITDNFSGDIKATFLDSEAPVPSIIEPVEDAPEKNKNTNNGPKWNWRQPESSFLPPVLTLGPVEVGVAMGLINLLFLLFVIVQIPYLFGGFELVQQSDSLKLAEYARRGFGELVTVAALVLPILLFSHWLLRKESGGAEKIYRAMAGIQIALLFVIMASAAQRLLILTGNLGYGLTTVRFYPMVFMIWLAIVFLWFAFTVLRGARTRFAWGAFWSALAVLGVLHVVNPDGFIVKTNVGLMREGRSFDQAYNSNLSSDSIPYILEAFPNISSDHDESTMKHQLARRFCELRRNDDLRTFSLSRWRARRAFESDGNWALYVGDCERFDYRGGFD